MTTGVPPQTGQMLNLFEYEANAERLLSKPIWDSIAGGAMDEVTLRRNRSAFESIGLRPRYLRQDISQRSTETTVLGTPISMPIMVSPAGNHGWAHPDGEKATARGAEKAGTICMLPTVASFSIEDVSRAAAGPKWFQLYHRQSQSEGLIRRAEAAGYQAIVVTCDSPGPSPKERDLRHGFHSPVLAMGRGANFAGGTPEVADPIADRSLTVESFDWLRSLTALPIVAKGIVTPEDAIAAVDHGANAILVSNHGGRLLDGVIPSIEALGPIVAAVGSRAEVYLDSGIRRGTDVLKALALGARAVSIGRPFYWGLAAGGADGVAAVLGILREELDRAMAFCGVTRIDEIDQRLLAIPADFMRGRPT